VKKAAKPRVAKPKTVKADVSVTEPKAKAAKKPAVTKTDAPAVAAKNLASARTKAKKV
jgi:hypothetical protein